VNIFVQGDREVASINIGILKIIHSRYRDEINGRIMELSKEIHELTYKRHLKN